MGPYQYLMRTGRQFFRRHMRPLSIDDAEEKRQKVALFYCILSFVGSVIYGYGVWERESKMTTEEKRMRTFNILKTDTVKLITFENLTKVESVTMKKTDDNTIIYIKDNSPEDIAEETNEESAQKV